MSLTWTATKLPKKRPEIWRKRKVDLHKALVAVNEDRIITAPPFFAVLDGHGGQQIGIEAEKLLRKKLGKKSWVQRGETEEAAMSRIFKEIDRELYSTIQQIVKTKPDRFTIRPWQSGSTCTAVKIARNGRELLCASIGDSQLFSFEYDEASGGYINTFSTPHHSATDHQEIARIEAAGGRVYGARVGGTLAVARSFGDFDLEKNNSPFRIKNGDLSYPGKMIVSAEPSVSRLSLQSHNGEEVWWVLASDGLWDIVEADYIGEILDEIREDYSDIPWKEKTDILISMLPHATESRLKWIKPKRGGGGASLPPVYDEENGPKLTEYPHDDRSIIVFVTNLRS